MTSFKKYLVVMLPDNQNADNTINIQMENETISINIPSGIKGRMDKMKIPTKNQKQLFKSYVTFLLGTEYGTATDSFMSWAEDEDNIVEFLK